MLRNRRHGLLLTTMDLVEIYQGFSDRTRQRLLHLLAESPLCVCHFQSILGESQVKISKHLAYLRKRGLVEVERDGNWKIYSLPRKREPALEANLQCLRECVASDKTFARDLKKLAEIRAGCCEPTTAFLASTLDRRRYGQAKHVAQ